MIVLFILFCFITGLSIINIVKKQVGLSTVLILSIPLGIVLHTLIFICMSFMNIYYNKYMFIAISLLTLFSFLKKRFKIINDLKGIPIYYIVFIGYIGFRLMIMAGTGFFEFYNYDEFTAYQTGSTITYLTHGFSELYKTYAPVNYFVGTMSLEFVGISITAARLITVLFFCLTSLFIFKALRENKVNRHISALLAMLFLVSSSEMLQMAKSFYTNVYFMVYFTMGVYGIIHHYFVKKEKGIPYLYFILIIGMLLTRKEAMYLSLVILLLISIIAIFKKLINKKQLLIMNLPLVFPLIWKITEKSYTIISSSTSSTLQNADSFVEKIVTRLSFPNLSSFLDNAYIQTLSNDYYYYNKLIFYVLILTIIVFIIKLFRKKDKKYLGFTFIILFIEIMYIGIIIVTQLTMFPIYEYLVAASFSRYIIFVLGIDFIVLGCLLFSNTDVKLNKFSKIDKLKNKFETKRKLIKIKNPTILLIIPAYNEENNILNTVNSIINHNKKHGTNYDYVVINDGSTDNTENILRFNKINHIELIHNLGIGGAVQTGYKYAAERDYDVAVQFDGDGQHDINSVSKIIKGIIAGESDLIIGSRFVDKDIDTFKSSYLRRIGIKLISITMKVVTKKKIYDTTSGFRACNNEIINQFAKNYPVEYPEPISTVYMLKKGYIVDEIQVNMNGRINGISSIHSWKSIYYMVNVFLSIVVVGLRRKK